MSITGLGVKTDLEKLIKTFGETDTVRYEVFSEIWRAMKMNKLCAGRLTEREAREFLEIVFELAVPFLLPPFPFQTRVCALYILYGVYMTQPCQPGIKIRMTFDQWSEVVTFMETVAEQKHLDVNFVFHKLRTLKAFHFVATSAENYPRSAEGEGQGDNVSENLPEVGENLVKGVVNSTLLQHIEGIQNQYYSMKCRLSGPDASHPQRSLDILNDNLVLNVKQVLTTFEEKRQNLLSGSTSQVDVTETAQLVPGAVQDKTESVGNKRRRIRNKAYGKQSSPFRSPLRGDKSMVDESDSPGKATGRGKRKGKAKGSGGAKKDAKKKKETETLIGENLEPETGQSNSLAGGDHPGSSMLNMPLLVTATDNNTEKSTINKDSPKKKQGKGSTMTKLQKGLRVSLQEGQSPAKKKTSPVKVKDTLTRKRKASNNNNALAVQKLSSAKKTKNTSKKN